jgi:hypothetical protein
MYDWITQIIRFHANLILQIIISYELLLFHTRLITRIIIIS